MNISGHNIRQLRIRAGYSQHQLAEKLQLCGIEADKYMIYKIEAQKRKVCDYELKYIADILGVSAVDLLLKSTS